MRLEVIARIYNDFPTKFGLPRQSGLAPSLISTIVFEPEYANADALRGLDGFSHLWLIWGFSEAQIKGRWSPTVRPPVLGGNKRVGVFATRSPFRPNSLGLTCVVLREIIKTESRGTVLSVSGADIMDGSPIYDIKPYVPYADCYPDALGGFSVEGGARELTVTYARGLIDAVPPQRRAALTEVLSSDPRPAYQDEPGRVYGFEYAGLEVKFTVSGKELTVCGITPVKGR